MTIISQEKYHEIVEKVRRKFVQEERHPALPMLLTLKLESRREEWVETAALMFGGLPWYLRLGGQKWGKKVSFEVNQRGPNVRLNQETKCTFQPTRKPPSFFL
jgi:hypothetical protein